MPFVTSKKAGFLVKSLSSKRSKQKKKGSEGWISQWNVHRQERGSFKFTFLKFFLNSDPMSSSHTVVGTRIVDPMGKPSQRQPVHRFLRSRVELFFPWLSAPLWGPGEGGGGGVAEGGLAPIKAVILELTVHDDREVGIRLVFASGRKPDHMTRHICNAL